MGSGGVYAAARRDGCVPQCVGFTELGAREGNESPNAGKASAHAGSLASGPGALESTGVSAFTISVFENLSAATRVPN
jgi:hypothetical protein